MLFLLHADPVIAAVAASTIVASAATLAAFATPPVGGYRAPDAPFLNRPLPFEPVAVLTQLLQPLL